MKKFLKIMSSVLVFSFAVSLSGCSDNKKENESSVETVSVVSTEFSVYEKKMLKDAVETPLEVACTTLYKCVCTGSITQKTVADRPFSFSKDLPLDNTSPAEKKRIANSLKLSDAIEYFELEEVYSNDNIRQYGYLTVTYSDVDLIKGTVVKIENIDRICKDYRTFDSLQIRLGDFINSDLLLSR